MGDSRGGEGKVGHNGEKRGLKTSGKKEERK